MPVTPTKKHAMPATPTFLSGPDGATIPTLPPDLPPEARERTYAPPKHVNKTAEQMVSHELQTQSDTEAARLLEAQVVTDRSLPVASGTVSDLTERLADARERQTAAFQRREQATQARIQAQDDEQAAGYDCEATSSEVRQLSLELRIAERNR